MLTLKNNHLLRHQSWVDGQWCGASQDFAIIDPASQAEIVKVASAGVELAQQAVVVAHQAFQSWQKTSAQERNRLLTRISQLLLDNIADLALLLTTEQGKPLAEAENEIRYASSYFEWYAGEAVRIYGRLVPPLNGDQRIVVNRHPLGVVTAITPWNFPCAMLARKLAPALAAGCTFVAKPAMETPLSALALGYLTQVAGVPDGVVNIVLGTDAQAVGEVFTQHPHVAKFTFTGSTVTGKKLLSQCAGSIKRTSMELGGNAPFIVFEDANLEAAVDALMAAKFRNTGQTCVSANRILLHSTIAEPFLALIRQRLSKMQIGDGRDMGTVIGPLIHSKAVNKIQALLIEAKNKGAQIECFGQREFNSPAFIAPHLVTGVTPDMAIFNTEIFGPIISVINFNREEEAIALANATDYGLVAYFYSQNMQRIWRLSERLEFGMLGINDVRISNAAAPFGGIKQSGFGREGGAEGIEDYLLTRYITWGDCE